METNETPLDPPLHLMSWNDLNHIHTKVSRVTLVDRIYLDLFLYNCKNNVQNEYKTIRKLSC